jgi:Sortase domain
MPLRGSAQLLLLFFRSRSRLAWAVGAIVGVLVVAGLLRAGGDFPLLTRTGLAKVIRQSVWQHALAETPEQAPWPWADRPAATDAKVPRLGLSAAIGKDEDPSQDEDTALESTQPAGESPQEPRNRLSEVGIGDHITVTTADGSSRVYRVTGHRVVDPHLAESDTGALDADPTLVTCLPLDPLLASSLRLVIQATGVAPPTPPALRPEQKL